MPPHSTTMFQQDDCSTYCHTIGYRRRQHDDELCVRGARPRRRSAPLSPAGQTPPPPAPLVSTPTSSCENKPKRKQYAPGTRVTFAPVFDVTLIEHVNELTPEEIQNAWFSRKEMCAIRRHCIETVALLNSGHISLPVGLCTRGLEHHTVSNLQQRKQIKRCANEAVFGIQKFQNFKGLSLPTLMAELYETSSEESKKRALDIAETDALDAVY